MLYKFFFVLSKLIRPYWNGYKDHILYSVGFSLEALLSVHVNASIHNSNGYKRKWFKKKNEKM